MKVLIADKFPINYVDEIISLGYECSIFPDITTDELVDKIRGFNILIVRSKKVSSEIIKSSDVLKIIIRAGSGYDTIDVDSARENNIVVSNVPGKNSIAVAELTIGLILSIDRRIPDNVIDLRRSEWNKGKYSIANGIFGKTLGVIGAGKIGLEVIKRAISFGMKILVFDPDCLNNNELNQIKINHDVEFIDNVHLLSERADIITLHVPLNSNTEGMINKDFLNHVKDNSVIINTSRGKLIVEKDLLEAINNKNLRVGIDVYNNEPKSKNEYFNSEIIKHPNVYGTHHIGASTNQAQNSVAEEVVLMLKLFKDGTILNRVN